MALKIYGNLDRTSLNKGLVQSAGNLIPKAAPSLAAGDSTVVDLFLTGQNGLENIQDYPTVRLGIGSLNARPTGGTWDYGAQTGLDYNISAAALDTAITAENAACTVTELTPFVFKVVFDAVGAQTISAVDASALTPSSSVSIKKLVEGDGSTQEQWLIRIFRNPVALIDSAFTNIAGSGIRGSLNLGTAEVYDLLASASSVNSTIELELTDSNGDVQTIFQVPITITGEVIGDGATGVATFGSYALASSLTNGALDMDVASIETDTINVTATTTATFAGDVNVAGRLDAETVKVNGGGAVNMFQKYETQQNFGSVAGHATATATITATGVDSNTLVFAGKPEEIADPFVVGAVVATNDVLTISVHNTANASQSSPTATFRILAVRFV